MTPTVAFFNTKGGVGRTSLVYHLAWMYADLGHQVLAVDLDPQANLTAAMVDEARLEELSIPGGPLSIHGAIAPVMSGAGDVLPAHREQLAGKLELVVGDLATSRWEDELALQWPRCLDRQERAFRVISAFHRVIQSAAAASSADVVLVDLGPNLGSVNRAALIACRHVVIPVAPDLGSIQGLCSLGPTLRQWREEWADRAPRNPVPTLNVPQDAMHPAGYAVVGHPIRLDRPTNYDLWMNRLPEAYAVAVLDATTEVSQPSQDTHCLGLLKWYGSLMPMAQEARKPIFHLRPADGALGAHATAAREARADFEAIANRIAEATWLPSSKPRPRRA